MTNVLNWNYNRKHLTTASTRTGNSAALHCQPVMQVYFPKVKWKIEKVLKNLIVLFVEIDVFVIFQGSEFGKLGRSSATKFCNTDCRRRWVSVCQGLWTKLIFFNSFLTNQLIFLFDLRAPRRSMVSVRRSVSHFLSVGETSYGHQWSTIRLL